MREIPLSQGMAARVDDEDYERAMQFKWCAKKGRHTYYGHRGVVSAEGVWTTELLHNFILGFKGVDHIDGDGLNDQKENLRRATATQNNRAFRRKALGKSSRFRGVNWEPRLGKWKAQLEVGEKNFYLGVFAEETEAAKAYDASAREHFGEFAAPNFP